MIEVSRLGVTLSDKPILADYSLSVGRGDVLAILGGTAPAQGSGIRVVIDDPNTDLMNARFGTRSGETPGDVYWDMFRRNNQNRKSQNQPAMKKTTSRRTARRLTMAIFAWWWRNSPLPCCKTCGNACCR